MIVFGFGDNLRANPGNDRDYYDDKLTSATFARLVTSTREPSPGLRNWVTQTHAKFGFQKDPQFYEGMLCGLAMAAQLMSDLSEGNEAAAAVYSGLRGLVGVQAGVVAQHLAATRYPTDGGEQKHGEKGIDRTGTSGDCDQHSDCE